MLLRGDSDPQNAALPPVGSAFDASKQADDQFCAARFVLRGVGGTYSGCSFNLCEPLLIGRGADARIRLDEPALAERHARVELHGDRVILRDLAGEGTLVNGVRIKDALLNSGDQLAFEQHRFVIEAPGLQAPKRRHDATPLPAVPNNTQTMRAIPGLAPTDPPTGVIAGPAPPAPRSGSTVWWLILAAALLGTVIALLLIYAPRLGG
jgi:predicted RNA-binding protein